jgi:glutathione S-transferase
MTEHTPYPALYSFRRCPYAMRARLAIAYAGVTVELREVVLRHKPIELLTASPKGTVPVLVLPDSQVIEESLDIMHWAIQQSDPANWTGIMQNPSAQSLIHNNDGEFKYYLDRYKYADRYPEHAPEYYRQQAEVFLNQLEQCLQRSPYLFGSSFNLADAAIAPFVRQFAAVDADWFASAPYPALQQWLNAFINSALFQNVMLHYQPWNSHTAPVLFAANAAKHSI